MKHPGIVECDLCRNEIASGLKHALITIPLGRADRDAIRAEIERDMPKMPQHSIFGMVPIERMVPEVWQFEVCLECISGILPMLADLKVTQIRHILTERAAARARGQQQEEQEA